MTLLKRSAAVSHFGRTSTRCPRMLPAWAILLAMVTILIVDQRVTEAQGIDAAGLDSQSEYPTINPGESINIWVRVRNTGSTIWRSDCRDGYGYDAQDGWGPKWGQGCLWREVPPGTTIDFADAVTPPSQPGTYRYGFLITRYGGSVGPYFYIDVSVRAQQSQSPSPARQRLGGMDLDAYCANHGGGRSQAGTNVADWSCVGGVGTRGIDFNGVCQWHYGRGALPAYDDYNNPFTWYCYREAGTPQASTPPVSTSGQIGPYSPCRSGTTVRVVRDPVGHNEVGSWDIVCESGEIVAMVTGTVRWIQNDVPDALIFSGPSLGNVVWMDGEDGYCYLAGHLQQGSVSVLPGQRVTHGERIGWQGNSGWSFSPHVHVNRMTGCFRYVSGNSDPAYETAWGNPVELNFLDIGAPGPGSYVSGNYP